MALGVSFCHREAGAHSAQKTRLGVHVSSITVFLPVTVSTRGASSAVPASVHGLGVPTGCTGWV